MCIFSVIEFFFIRYEKEVHHGAAVMKILRICCALDPRYHKKALPLIRDDLITEAVALGECLQITSVAIMLIRK